MAGGAPEPAIIVLRLCRIGSRFGGGSGLGGAPRLFFGLASGFLSRLFLGLAVFLGAALFLFARLALAGLVATAGFLERRQARFFGLAQQPGLHFLPGGDVVDR